MLIISYNMCKQEVLPILALCAGGVFLEGVEVTQGVSTSIVKGLFLIKYFGASR